MKGKAFSVAAATCAVLVIGGIVQASVSYSVEGSSYTQNFDSLPNTPQNLNLQTAASPMMWADDTAQTSSVISIPGWYLYHPTSQTEGGTNGHQRMRIGAGTANTGAFMSFGASGSTERALGDVGSNTLASVGGDTYIGLRLTNDTGQVLRQFTLSYNGEQWRDGGFSTGGSLAAQTMTFGWSTTATTISDPNTSFTDVPALAFTSPVYVNTGGGVAVDGNTAGRVAISAVTITGLNWQPGADLWLRWNDINNVNNDHGLAIDDLSFSASTVPEPTTLVLLGISGLLLRRRRAA